MARIEAPKRPGPFARVAYWMSKRDYGKLPEPVELMAHHPGLLRGYGALEWEMDRASSVDDRLKELAWIKTAALVGCEWCLDIGSMLGARSGITEEQLRDLPSYRESSAFSEVEKLVLDYAVALSQTPAFVSDELFASLRARFSEKQLVELTTAVAIENYRARFNQGLGIVAQGFTSGACALPERPAEVAA